MNLIKLAQSNDSWGSFEADWEKKCADSGEDFSEYYSARLTMLKEISEEDQSNSSVYALSVDSEYVAVFFANRAQIKGAFGWALRIRQITFSPDYDFGVKSSDEYTRVLAAVVASAIRLSREAMPSDHIRVHLPSPNDHAFFGELGEALAQLRMFESIATRGSWFYLTYSQQP